MLQITQHVRGHGAVGIIAGGLHVQFHAAAVGHVFGEPRNLRGGEISQDGIRQRAFLGVMRIKILRVEHDGLTDAPAHLRNNIVHHAKARLLAQSLEIVQRQAKRFQLGLAE